MNTQTIPAIRQFIENNFDTGMSHPSWPYINALSFVLSFITGIIALIFF